MHSDPVVAPDPSDGLSLAPVRGLRPNVSGDALARRLCPPYDVISRSERERLADADPANVVRVILPVASAGEDAYTRAARTLTEWTAAGLLVVDTEAAYYVYEMAPPDDHPTRGLIGAVELRDPADGVILPHENTMAGPVADRLALMTATDADLEPIYLAYDGGGRASELVAAVDSRPAIVETTTADGVRHRLWLLTDPTDHAAITADLAGRRALIADGHHRYATYRERQRVRREQQGPGPWDHGLALLVDSSEYGPQVHPIHRVVPGLDLAAATSGIAAAGGSVAGAADLGDALDRLERVDGFAVVLSDASAAVLVDDPDAALAVLTRASGGSDALAALDVSVLHRAVISSAWGLEDNERTVEYAHTVQEALERAAASGGLAILLRATPVAAVAGVAAQGERMPRKSTLFTPKPASGLVMRRLADQP